MSQCTEVNQKLGNLYQIQNIALWTEEQPPALKQTEAVQPEEGESSGIRTTGKRTTPVRNSDDNRSDSELHPSGKQTEDYTSLDSSIISYSLSTEMPDPLKNYFSSLKAYKKRERETGHYLNLQKSFSMTEIAEALDYLLGYGIPESGEHCHSPMAYLSQAMSEVLSAVRVQKESHSKTEAQQKQKEADEQAVEKARIAEEKLFENQRVAFERVFPTREAVENYLAKLSKKYPVLNAKGPVLLNLAIAEWSSQNQTNQIVGSASGARR